MPLYQFHLLTGAGPVGDATDRELADDAMALREARAAAVEALGEGADPDEANHHVIVRLERSGGELVALVTARIDVEIPA